ncbi:1-acyl-sn-glycerol-3-phosphate acyltransferases [Streptosporangium subroseum]|uniref:1-acyl-sn-glycerol-3-phosphate acyltransferases n=1 Tax=Streptosporangium subroseum TaxID=106412 RepID=A0A239IG69_9ACTN|nr:lysophospholipid acyltransferase family protein [Streptosporangium subroseum]SNS92565.1 1-acyl-sn-glycerol-3-phosphate acyltransferases [Streptosporangium subroseum]
MNPWLPVAPCMPTTCLVPSDARAAWPRRTLRLTAAVILILAGTVFALLTHLLGTAERVRVTSVWSRLLLRALGVRIEVRQGFTFLAGSAERGFAPGSRAKLVVAGSASGVSGVSGVSGSGAAPLIVANHVSWLDPLVMAAALPCRLLAKREVQEWPVIGMLAAGSGALFIDRDRLSALPEAVDAMARALGEGHPVMAFPEGTTWCGREMGAFRPAVFQAALNAEAPVRPVALRYVDVDGALATGSTFVGDDTLLASIQRVVAFRRLVVEVTMLPPVTAENRRVLAWKAEASVASVIMDSARHTVPAAPAAA